MASSRRSPLRNLAPRMRTNTISSAAPMRRATGGAAPGRSGRCSITMTVALDVDANFDHGVRPGFQSCPVEIRALTCSFSSASRRPCSNPTCRLGRSFRANSRCICRAAFNSFSSPLRSPDKRHRPDVRAICCRRSPRLRARALLHATGDDWRAARRSSSRTERSRSHRGLELACAEWRSRHHQHIGSAFWARRRFSISFTVASPKAVLLVDDNESEFLNSTRSESGVVPMISCALPSAMCGGCRVCVLFQTSRQQHECGNRPFQNLPSEK